MNQVRGVSIVLFAVGLLALAPPCSAADKTDDRTREQEEKADAINEVITAYKTADFGREHRAPEALIAAASMLRKVYLNTGGKLGELDARPTVEDENGEEKKTSAAAAQKPRGLDEEADALFDEASTLGVELKQPGVEGLIRAARARTYGRGAYGGPKEVTRPIVPGEVHVYHVPFVTGVPAAIGIKSAGAAPLRCKMTIGNYVHFEQVVKFGEYNWMPKPDEPVKTYTIRIANVGKKPTVYTLLTN